MRHSVFGRKLSRTKNERRRLFSGLVRDLLLRDRIITSLAKAKAVQPMIEKLISKAKNGSEANRRRVLAVLSDRKLTQKLFEDAKTRFSSRTSGFTRIVKAGLRLGDATQTVVFSFVDEQPIVPVSSPKLPKLSKRSKLHKKEKKP